MAVGFLTPTNDLTSFFVPTHYAPLTLRNRFWTSNDFFHLSLKASFSLIISLLEYIEGRCFV